MPNPSPGGDIARVGWVMKLDRIIVPEPEYAMCRYPGSKVMFRGPRCAAEAPDVALVGGAEVFGRFQRQSLGDRIAQATGSSVANFGCLNAGIDVFLNDEAVLEICRNARVVVLEVMGAHNMSNRFYRIHPRRNDRFIAASSLMRSVFSGVDFTDFTFTRHMLTTVKRLAPERFDILVEELQAAWLARMELFLRKIGAPVHLLWLAREPLHEGRVGLGYDPLFVTGGMIDTLRDRVASLIEVVPTAREIRTGSEGLTYTEADAPAARQMLGTVAQEKAAKAIVEVL